MLDVPPQWLDPMDLPTTQGFVNGPCWYHGTSSALLDSIRTQGLLRSGDKALRQAIKKTMATIGNRYTDSVEPVFLTPSRALAHFWARQAVRKRTSRSEGEERPVVLALQLDATLSARVRPDVGAAALLMVEEGSDYLSFVAALYRKAGLDAPDFDAVSFGRMDFLTRLGMAYIDQDIPAACLTVLP